MPLTQNNITAETPMGANLLAGGASFRLWAPRALRVHIQIGDANYWTPDGSNLLRQNANGHWTGFVPNLIDGTLYRFYIVGKGSEGFKRDPYARELGPGFPHCACILRDPNTFPWKAEEFKRPKYKDLIIYQLHVGTFYGLDSKGKDSRSSRISTFLDVLDRLPHLKELGITSVQLLPIVEFPTQYSLGYNGTDYYSPEMDYEVDIKNLNRYLITVNQLYAEAGHVPLDLATLAIPINQFKCLIDLFHLNGISVLLDVVYNHAGGDFGDESIYFLDRAETGDNANSLYFKRDGWAGGLVFDYEKPEVRQYLIDNASFFLEEYRVDGFRFDEVTVMERFGGWRFCQDLTETLKYDHAGAVLIAEYWNDQRWWALDDINHGGADFDMVMHDGIRSSVRAALEGASHGNSAPVSMEAIARSLKRSERFPYTWSAVQHLENHDLVRTGGSDSVPRIPTLSDPSNPRSWWARSRSRVATGLLMTSPGIPFLFMGQEILEDKQWSDNTNYHKHSLVWWEGLDLGSDPHMVSFKRFCCDLIALRKSEAVLREETINVYHSHNLNRIIAFHRWQEGLGNDIVVVASLNENTFWNYRLGFPLPGRWAERLNSEYYDVESGANPIGNLGKIQVRGSNLHNLPYSCEIVIPANSILIFSKVEN